MEYLKNKYFLSNFEIFIRFLFIILFLSLVFYEPILSLVFFVVLVLHDFLYYYLRNKNIIKNQKRNIVFAFVFSGPAFFFLLDLSSIANNYYTFDVLPLLFVFILFMADIYKVLYNKIIVYDYNNSSVLWHNVKLFFLLINSTLILFLFTYCFLVVEDHDSYLNCVTNSCGEGGALSLIVITFCFICSLVAIFITSVLFVLLKRKPKKITVLTILLSFVGVGVISVVSNFLS